MSYTVALSSDDARFGGAGSDPGVMKVNRKVPCHGFQQSITLTVPPMTTLYLVGKPRPKRTPKAAKEKAAPAPKAEKAVKKTAASKAGTAAKKAAAPKAETTAKKAAPKAEKAAKEAAAPKAEKAAKKAPAKKAPAKKAPAKKAAPKKAEEPKKP